MTTLMLWLGTFICLCLCLLGAAPRAAEAIPHFGKRETYQEARQTLIAAGWKPAHDMVGIRCEPDDDRCKDYPEVDACSESDTGACRFSWIAPKGTVFAIATTGDKPVVVGASCLEKCE